MTLRRECDSGSNGDLLARMVVDRLVVLADGGNDKSVAHLRRLGARDVLKLVPTPSSPDETRFVSSARVGTNNCTVAILNNRATFALRARKFFRSFETILVPLNFSILGGSFGLARYLIRRQLIGLGHVRLDGFAVPLAAYRNAAFADRPRHRIFAPREMTPLGIMQAISDVDAVALRWIEAVEAGDDMTDLDLLVRGSAADEVERRLSSKVGTFPIDLYTDDGSGKRLFKAVPYFPPLVAARVLDSAILRASGVRAPSSLWRYVAYAFHLLFHKSDRLVVGADQLTMDSFGNERYVNELWRLADAAGERRPTGICDIEELLHRNGAFPELDTIGFYSSGNAFLTARYISGQDAMRPGLGVFVLRDFGLPDDLIGKVREQLHHRSFIILSETPIPLDHDAVKRIRGGNWLDDQAPRKRAPPIHAFVCLDTHAAPPSRAERRRYPRLDNANMLLKTKLRTAYAAHGTKSKLNIIHASDNSAEAKLYAELLGLANEPSVAAAIASLSVAETD